MHQGHLTKAAVEPAKTGVPMIVRCATLKEIVGSRGFRARTLIITGTAYVAPADLIAIGFGGLAPAARAFRKH